MMRIIKNRQDLPEQKKISNQGSAMVITIVAIALLSLMVSSILTLVYYNVRMQSTDLTGKNTFYTVETAMDEIRAGLQNDVAQSFSAAYLTTMEKSVETAVADRETLFKNEFINDLRPRVSELSNSAEYSTDHLKTFLKNNKYNDTTKIGARIETTEGNNKITLTEGGLVLNGVIVKYYGEDGFVSEISTDIVLAFPEVDFTQGANNMEFLNYVVIANKKLAINGATIDAKGSIYGGKDGMAVTASSVKVDNGAASVSQVIVTNKDLSSAVGSNIQFNNTEVWARNIVADSGSLDINGNTFLSNDLVVENTSGGIVSTSIRLNGSFYGYGSLDSAKSAYSMSGKSTEIANNPAAYSSAILVNGAKATVDLSGLSTMVIAGNSYIGASTENDSVADFAIARDNEDVAMGESISIKSNQTAYLVPAECIAPMSEYGKVNPMPAARFNKLREELGDNEDNYVDIESTITKNYGVTLKNLGVTGCKVVCYPIQNLGSMVYFFMEFDSQASANSFFRDYYANSANLSRLEENLDLYTYGIKVPSMGAGTSDLQFYYNGNIVVNEDSGQSFYVNKLHTISSENAAQLLEVEKAYYDIFNALGKNLSKNYTSLSPTQLMSDVYGNLVTSFATGDAKTNIPNGYKKVFVTAGTNGIATVISNGDYVIDSTNVSGEDLNGNATTGKVTVVIASGDVRVRTDFEGMIIAGGKVIVDNDVVTMKSSPTNVTVALTTENKDGVKPIDYLIGVSDLLVGGSATSSGKDDIVNVSDLVGFTNWKKQ